jgi:hypothetical protein
MPKHIRDLRRLFAAVAVFGPALACAWTPYGYGPSDPWTGGPSPSQPPAAPGQEGSPPSTATPPYPGQEAPYPPDYPYPGFGGPGFEPYGPGFGSQPPGYPPFGPPPGFGGFERRGPAGPGGISRQATEDAYILEIPLEGMKPEDIQVSTQGRWISISRGQTAQQTRQETFDQGRGYVRSFSYSTGSGARRLTLPRDADPEAMSREDGEDAVRILIPRRHD